MVPLYTLHRRTLHSSVVVDSGQSSSAALCPNNTDHALTLIATDEHVAKLSFSRTGGIEVADLVFLELSSGQNEQSPTPSVSSGTDEDSSETTPPKTFMSRLKGKTKRRVATETSLSTPSSLMALAQAGIQIAQSLQGVAPSVRNVPSRRPDSMPEPADDQHVFRMKDSPNSTHAQAHLVWTKRPSPTSRSRSSSFLPPPSSTASSCSFERPSSYLSPPRMERTASSDSTGRLSFAAVSEATVSGTESSQSSRSTATTVSSASSFSSAEHETVEIAPSVASVWTCHVHRPYPNSDPSARSLQLATLRLVADHAQLAAQMSLVDQKDDALDGFTYTMDELEECVGVTSLWLTAKEARRVGGSDGNAAGRRGSQ